MRDFITPAEITGSLCLDRLAFLVFSPNLSVFDKDSKEYKYKMKKIDEFQQFFESLNLSLDEDFSQGVRSELFLHHYRTAKCLNSEGIDIQFGSKMPIRNRIKNESFVDAFGTDEEKEQGFIDQYEPSVYGLRIEYNPTKDDISILAPVFKYFGRSNTSLEVLLRIVRLDIALDYPYELVPELILCNRMRKGFAAFGTSGIESIYFGSRYSKYYFRIYDKKRELYEKQKKQIEGNLWRVELESKKPFSIMYYPKDEFQNVFERLNFYDGGLSSGDWRMDMIRSQAMIYGVKSVLGKLPRETAKRYKKQLNDFALSCQKFEHPVEVFNREFPEKFNDLRNSVLTAFGV